MTATDGRQMAVVSSVPSALSRWTEQSQILDTGSIHILVGLLKIELKKYLLECREKERHKEKAAKEKADREAPTAKEPSEITTTSEIAQSDIQATTATSVEADSIYEQATSQGSVETELPVEAVETNGEEPMDQEGIEILLFEFE